MTLWANTKPTLNNDNDYNDDNMMRANVWFEFFDDFFSCQSYDIWEGNVTTRSEIRTQNIYSLGF